MGRRKIEIRPIKDDRNRSVTFLKRKGGLFKKAYELGVLCQVDVAVIIFGHNKKLYEFSSGDINDTIGRFQYYAGAHEHKGPADFAGKGGGDDDDDEDVDIGTPPPDSNSPPEPMTHPLHQQPGLGHIRHATPSASPPMPNGHIPMQHRASPQPQTMSRPASRTAMPRRPSNLAPPQYTPPQAQMQQQQQQQYAYAQNQYYGQQPNMQRPQPSPPYPTPGHPQMQMYMQDQRRQSLPPGFQQQLQQVPPPQPSPQPHLQPPEQPLSRKHTPQPPENNYTSPPIPQPKAMSQQAKSHSIFTPIEDSRSLLAQHWGPAPTSDAHDQSKLDTMRSMSIDVGSMSYENRMNGTSPLPPPSAQSAGHYPAPPAPHRSNSSSSVPSLAPPSRSSTMQSDARRPRLRVEIPSEASDGGEATADTSAGRDTAVAVPPMPPKGVVLPPPSPSAGNPLLSAGATGPPNPFARPAPPANQSINNRELETPLSALPSRVMEGNMLPSPSDIWGNMFSSRSNNDNMMPSPLNFQPTPIATSGTSWRDDPDDRKRKAEAEFGSAEKRIRT